jgi:hypothetical protein
MEFYIGIPSYKQITQILQKVPSNYSTSTAILCLFLGFQEILMRVTGILLYATGTDTAKYSFIILTPLIDLTMWNLMHYHIHH